MKLVYYLLFFVSASTFAQLNKGAFDDYIYFVNQNRPTYEGIEGTPFLTENFIPARINEFDRVVYIRFNVFANSIEFKKPDGEVAILSLENEYTFKLLDGFNTEYAVHDYVSEKESVERTFFKKIKEEERFTLFMKENVKYTQKKIATSGFEQNQPARFTKAKGTFFIGQPKGDFNTLLAVPSRKKEMGAFFKDMAKPVMQFARNEGLKLDNEEDLVRMFQFYWDMKE